MRELTREFIKFFVSLKLTVALLALSALLVFFATIDQVHLGIWAVQEKWFRSFIVLQDIQGYPLPIFPGGYFIGGLLLINLVTSHIKRFAFTWKKAGIQLVHGGLILLLLGELFTGLFQEEYQVSLKEGETSNYAVSWRFNELAVADTTAPDRDIVTVIPESLLAHDEAVQVPALPFRIVPRVYYPNAALAQKEQVPAGQFTVPNLANAGLGPRFAVTPMRVTYDPQKKNWPAAFVDVVSAEGLIGTYLVSTMLVESETFTYAGRQWRIGLRPERSYQPYSLTLLKVTHDVYPGSDIPKNFSSRMRINRPDGSEDREVLIYMNNPLRHEGMTYYQYQMDAANANTVLQAVRNPSWLIPYISCLLMTLGLLLQFGQHLVGFVLKRAARSGSAAPVTPAAPAA